MEPKNWRTKYQDHRSFWQFNFNAWLSVNLIIILSNHPINVFYIYNDHQVSSPFLRHLSGVRYWNREGPWQNVREAFVIETETSACCRAQRVHPPVETFSPVFLNPFLHTRQSVLEKTQKERETKRSGVEANEWWKDFMPPPRLRSSAVCSEGKAALRANELPVHKYTEPETQEQSIMTWCLCFPRPC